MCKVCSLGLDTNIIIWLNNYLTKRTQAVVINGSESSTIPVLSGVYTTEISARLPIYHPLSTLMTYMYQTASQMSV